ncbi:HAD family hydrolase [Corynebacterium coyleae]|uniref:HAD family hydrolase n=1 Tax=Corynebacterium coyleae TaxID=53374 RepID=UPI001CCBA2BB|nr:HAD family hydrolase [Corynebacterium coyleae]MDK8240474.1 HAD family hydrolase [Corynebacterium coyleae]UBI08775.1 Cof-type HAD-IIB family hydrolase [Corynebacterium coyleae]
MKVAAFDFDGTLHHPPHGFDQEDIAAIDAWRNAGHLAISATGRSRTALAHGMAGSTLAFDYQVLSNGASATDGANRDLLFSHELDGAVLRAAVEQFGEREGLAIFGTTIGRVDGVFANNTGRTHDFTAHFTPMGIRDIPDHQFAVIPFWIPDNDALRAEVIAWATKLGDVEVAQNQDYIDLMAPGRSKGSGILELFEVLGINRDGVELYTFGDSWNDLSMHTLADHSHCFHHSPTDVKAATDHVIGSVAEVLDEYI